MENFNLDIVFTGICSVVLDKSIGSTTGFSVVIPDAWDKNRKTDHKGMDDKVELVRHGASIQIPSANLAVAPSLGGGAHVWYPRRHGIEITFDEATGAPNNFAVDASVGKLVADMTIVADKFKIKKEVIGGAPPKEVLANLAFPQKRGTLWAEKGVSDWGFSKILSSSTGEIKFNRMAFKVVLRMVQITKATIKATALGGGHVPRPGNPGSPNNVNLEVIGRSRDENVEIIVSNLCDVNPLSWEAEDSVPSEEDLDFKWHYECLSPQRADVKKTLNGGALPYPKKIDSRGGSGRNCFPALWVAEV
jgi:hypothetical protein